MNKLSHRKGWMYFIQPNKEEIQIIENENTKFVRYFDVIQNKVTKVFKVNHIEALKVAKSLYEETILTGVEQ